MCLVVFNWSPGQAARLQLVANRDEFYERPTQAMHWWDGENGLLAGKDLQEGGTWLAFAKDGRFALLTNIRKGYLLDKRDKSRGELPLEYLRAEKTIDEYAKDVRAEIVSYSGFNLLLGDSKSLYWMSSDHPEGQYVEPGLHVLSNQALDTSWPKTDKALKQLSDNLTAFESDFGKLSILTDRSTASDEQLPDTGVPFEWEKLLSAQTITSETYGTRSRCWLSIRGSNYRVLDQQLDSEGRVAEDREFRWQSSN